MGLFFLGADGPRMDLGIICHRSDQRKRGEKESGQAGGRKEIGFYLDELDFTFTANFSCQYLAC